MYINNKYSTHIKIRLEPGIYIFDNESATGKTRLCKQLKKLNAYGEPVAAITYNDILSGIDINTVFNQKSTVIMLDRYDMYNTQAHDLINRLKNSCIILIDCKSAFTGSTEIQDCYIEMTENSIEVSL